MPEVNFVDERQKRTESYLLRLTLSEHSELKRIADNNNLSIAEVIRIALQRYCKPRVAKSKK